MFANWQNKQSYTDGKWFVSFFPLDAVTVSRVAFRE